MGIHSTSLVDRSARLHAGAEVGPYCVIGPGVTIGEGTTLVAHVLVTGHASVGAGNTIHPYAVIGGDAQDLGHHSDDSCVVLGDNNWIGVGVTVNSGTTKGDLSTTLGHRNRLGQGAHVAHDCRVADDCVLGEKCLLAGHVRVGNGASLGARSGVHQFATIGRLTAVGDSARVSRDVPPFMRILESGCAVDGVNAAGLRGQGIGEGEIEELLQVYQVLWEDPLPKPEALSLVKSRFGGRPLVQELLEFLKASDGGRMGRCQDVARRT
jgi:UDP-N-acetylglucosamine acyltransferase